MWEKAGINVSVVYGSMPAEAYRAATSQNGASPVRCQPSSMQTWLLGTNPAQ